MNSDKNIFISAITTNERHSKIDPKSLAQRWGIGLSSAGQTLKTTTQIGLRYAVHPLTRRYKTDIIHGYNARRLNTTIYTDALFSKFKSLNGNTCAQFFTVTKFIGLHPSKSKADAGECAKGV